MNLSQSESQEAAAGRVLNDPRWMAVASRSREADGVFYYSVKTTGIYCRPSCGARLARPENVRFHASCEEAEQAGFRPCKRCKPNQSGLAQGQAAMIVDACKFIEQSESRVALETLAKRAGISTFHFQRLFLRITGLTPKNYAAAQRAKQVRIQFEGQASITDAIAEAGYSSGSRFYEQSDALLGMTPSMLRSGGDGLSIRFALGECSLGSILVAHSGKGVCAILIGDDADALLRDLQDRFPKADLMGGDQDFELLVARIIGFVEAPALGLDLPLDIRGTAFQQRVWQALRDIPPGKTASYTDIANRIGAPKSVRAVAAACAANALALAIPCHRVVRTDGALAGYRWGLERKRSLLEKEASAALEQARQRGDKTE